MNSAPAARAGSTLATVAVCTGLLVTGCIRRTAETPAETASVPGAAQEQKPLEPVEIPEPSAAGTITVAVGERHQKLDGFGAAVAWFIDRIVDAPPKGVYELLFPELGTDILRLRNRYQRSKSGDNDLSWEVTIVRRATEALGYRPKILLTSWSPPSQLKASGREDCSGNEDCTLAKENGQFVYGKFADYWLKSLRHYDELGLMPDYISIQNEPRFTPSGWEGCRFDSHENDKYPGYDRALAEVHKRLAALPSPPKIIAPESLGIHGERVQDYLEHMNLDLVDAVAHHLYEKGADDVWDWRDPGPDSFIGPMRDLAAATTKPLWETEFGTDEDNGIEGGFETAWLMHNALVEEGVSAFLYWDLVWEPPGGLVSVSRGQATVRDQYYAVKHYARFTDPGYVRVSARSDASELRASAYLSPQGDQLSVVVLNPDPRTLVVHLEPEGFSPSSLKAYRTIYRPGRSERWTELPDVSDTNPVILPSRSQVTFVLRGAVAVAAPDQPPPAPPG